MRTVKVDGESPAKELPSDDTSELELSRYSGLLIRGKILDRTRRYIPMGRTPLEVVTYILVDGENKKYYVDDTSPETYYDINEIVIIPVYIKP